MKNKVKSRAKYRSAFTMIELIFVIVVIGILASIAMPKLWVTRDDAIIAKGRADVSTIRSAIATDRQKRMLEGNATIRSQLDAAATNTDDASLFSDMLQYPIYSKNIPGHWRKTFTNRYAYKLGDNSDVIFDYNTSTGSFDCDHTNANCKLLTQ